MSTLTSAQRKFLRAQAHALEPVVIVGKQGLTDALVRAAAEALETHELIKIRFNDHKDAKRDIAGQIAFRTGAEVVGAVGHVAILFRPCTDPEKRRIIPPAR